MIKFLLISASVLIFLLLTGGISTDALVVPRSKAPAKLQQYLNATWHRVLAAEETSVSAPAAQGDSAARAAPVYKRIWTGKPTSKPSASYPMAVVLTKKGSLGFAASSMNANFVSYINLFFVNPAGAADQSPTAKGLLSSADAYWDNAASTLSKVLVEDPASGAIVGNTLLPGSVNLPDSPQFFRLNPGSATTKPTVLPGTAGYIATGPLVLAKNGKFYGFGVARNDDPTSAREFFQYDPKTGKTTVIKKFSSAKKESVVEYYMFAGSDGNLYGWLLEDLGNFDSGIEATEFLFKITTAGVFTVLKKGGADGTGSYTYVKSFVESSDGNIYGISMVGMFFKINLKSGAVTHIAAIKPPGSKVGGFAGRLVEAPGGILAPVNVAPLDFGVTDRLLKITKDGKGVSNYFIINDAQKQGGTIDDIVKVNAKSLAGVSSTGGSNSLGTVFTLTLV